MWIDIDKFRNKDRKIIIERNKYLKWLIVIFVICIFTGLLTPIKDIPYTYMWKSIEGNTMDFISEHQPVVLINDYNLFIILAVIVIFIFSNKVKLKLSDLFMLMGMTVLSLISYKQFPIFFICAMCPVNKMITMWRDTRKLEKAQEKEYIVNLNKEELENTNYDEIAETLADSDVSEKKRKKNQTKNGLERAKKIINKIPSKILTVKGSIYIILITIIISLLGYRYIVGTDLIDKSNYPVAAADWMLENLDVKNIKLFNDFNYGSYLLYRGIPVFIDGRADVYDPVFNGRSDDSYLAYMLGSSLQLWYEDVFFTYNITHVITYVNSNLNQVMERGISYNMIYNDGTFVIYEIHFDNEENKEEQKPAEN